MDYDTWLTTPSEEPFNFEEEWFLNEDVLWNNWKNHYDFNSCKEFLEDNNFGNEKLSKLWEEEIKNNYYPDEQIMDIWELSEKYPEVADEFYNKVKPKDIEELLDFLYDEYGQDDSVEYFKHIME